MTQSQARSLAFLLGVKPKKAREFTSLDLADAIGRGLSVEAVDRLSALIAPAEPGLRYRIVPKATLARRQRARTRRLSPEESERLARLARIWAFAIEVWGSEDAARRFLARPHPLLRGRLPVVLATETEIGARAVENVLGGLKHGTAV